MFEELWNFIQDHYAAKRYHLVLGNIQLLIPLFKPHLHNNRAALEVVLNQLQNMLEKLDGLAAEFHFRDYLHRYFINPLYQQIKAFDHSLAESFLKGLMKRIPRSDWGKIRYAKYEHTFEAFCNIEDEDPNERLRLARGQQIALLENNMADNQYVIWSETVLSYLDAQLRAGYAVSKLQLTALLDFLEALLAQILSSPEDKNVAEAVWPEVFIAQRLLSNNLAQVSITQNLSYEVLKQGWTERVGHAFGSFLLPILAQYIAAHPEEDCAVYYTLAQQINRQLTTQAPHSETILFADHRFTLQTMRAVFVYPQLSSKLDVNTPQGLAKAQQQFTQDTLNLLNQFVQNTATILGDAPCDFALCALGSTSREDRRPYSDVELMLLYVPKPKVNPAQLQTYLHYLATGVEYLIKQCGESHKENEDPALLQMAGFRLDDSSHLLKKGLIGTPQDIANKFIIQVMEHWQGAGHAWLSDESFYSLLSPVVINANSHGSKAVFSAYQQMIQSYLNGIILKEDQLHVLTQSLSLTAPLSFSDLKRREAIALSCLYDVTLKSKALLRALKPTEVVNIKDAFYKPLTYLALNLKLFYGLTAKHPAEIFAEAASKLSWGERQVVRLLQTALSYITHIQVKLHLKYGYQEERVIWLSVADDPHAQVSALSAEEYAGLSIIKDGLLLPLGQWLAQIFNTQDSLELYKVLPYLLKSYLAKRDKPWLQTWTQHASHYLPLAELLRHPLVHVLSDTPSPDGWSPTFERQWRAWLMTVSTLFQAPQKNLVLSASGDSNRCVISGFPSVMGLQAAYDHFNLPTEITALHFVVLTGEIISNPDYSSRQHAPKSKTKPSKIFTHVWQDHTLFFKFKEGNRECLLGWEMAVELLHRLLGGPCQVAPGWPIKLTYMPAMGEPDTHWGWMSLGMQGESLGQSMLTDAGLLTDKHIDESRPWSQKKLQTIEPISYSQLFILALLTFPEDGQPWNFILEAQTQCYRLIAIDNGQSFVNPWELDQRGNVLKTLNVKTMLYLLPNFQQPLAPQVKEWIQLLNVDLVMQRWLNTMEEINNIFQPILEKELKAARVPEAQWSQHNKLIVMKETQIEFIRFRLFMLQSWLNKYPTGTPQALLAFLDPLVAAEYEKHQGRIKTPSDYYALSPHTYVLKPDLSKDIQQHYQASSRSYQALLSNSLQLSYIQLDKLAQGNYIAHIKSIHFEGMAASQQRFFLTLMQQLSFTEELVLAHCTELTNTILEVILKRSPNLMKLNIGYCPKLTEKSWVNIGRNCKHIKDINLEGNRQLKKLGKNIFGINEFKQLRTLNISGCELSKQDIDIPLTHINLLDQKTKYLKGDAKENDDRIEILLLGPVGDGKTNLMYRFAENRFSGSFPGTIGIEYCRVTMQLEKTFELLIWDTAGSPRFPAMHRLYICKAHVVICIVDITRLDSFKSILHYIDFVHRTIEGEKPIFLVGNKCDLQDQRQFTYKEGQQLAHKIGAFSYLECSAKTGENVKEIFIYATRAVIEKKITSDAITMIRYGLFLTYAEEITEDLLKVLYTGLWKNNKEEAKDLLQKIIDKKLYADNFKLKTYIEMRLKFFETKHLAVYALLKASRILYQMQRTAPTNSPLSFLTNDIILRISQQIPLVEKLSAIEQSKIIKYAKNKNTLTNQHNQKVFWSYFFPPSEDLSNQQNTIIALPKVKHNSPSNTR